MKYKVLLGPVQITADTIAHTEEIIDLPESDGTQLARWGIVEPIAESEPVAPTESPSASTTATAKTTTATAK